MCEPGTHRIFWAEYRSPELAAIAARVTVVIPIGATEQHGEHLPVGVDHLVIAELCERACRRATDEEHPVLVAPLVPYGSSHHHLPRAGTISLAARTAQMVLYDVMASLAVTGVRRVIVLNGHGGNDDLIRQAVRDVCLTHPVTAGAASYWTVGGAEVAALAARHGDLPVPGHAGGFETSLMCAIRPELVTDSPSRGSMARSTVAPGFYVEAHRWIDQIGGVSDPAAAATGEAGDEYLEVIISKLASGIRDVAVSAGPQINQGESSMVVT